VRVGVGHADLLIADTGIKNPFHPTLHKVLNVTVVELSGITNILAGNRFHAFFE